MTTKIRRGRDPEQHVVHSNKQEANAFIGLLGEVSLVRDETGIVELRAHDGMTPGGAVSAVSPAGEVGAGAKPRVVLPPFEVTPDENGLIAVHHQLGYYPFVQVLDENGGALQQAAPGTGDLGAGGASMYRLNHDDTENLTIKVADNSQRTIILS